MKSLLILTIFLLSFNLYAQKQKLDTKLKDTYARFENNILTIGNSKIVRVWKWTGKGFSTISLKNNETKREWCEKTVNQAADWTIPGLKSLPDAQLITVAAVQSDDEGFTDTHLEVIAEIAYPAIKTSIKYVVWSYPGVSGLRTQIFVKSEQTFPKITLDNMGIPLSELKVIKASSEESDNTKPVLIFDNDVNTSWESKIFKTKPDKPNYLIIDLQKEQSVNGVAFTQRNDYLKEGWIERFLVYVSNDTTNWGTPAGNGELSRADYPQYVGFPITKGRYIKVVIPSTSMVNVPRWKTSFSELKVFSAEFPYHFIDQVRADFLPINCSTYARTNVGYNADQQFRNSLEDQFLKEKTNRLPINEKETSDWSNILALENNREGVAFVKESHKTALQQGYLTGEFICSKEGLEITGWGIAPQEITTQYRKCWANWTIVYTGSADQRQLAIKIFDRSRYPTTLPGHKQIYANSWGYGVSPKDTWRERMDGALETNVLEAIKASNDMGIEAYLIDNGWTETPDVPQQVFPNGHRPNATYYPNGWETVKKSAKKNGVNLSLWTDIGIAPEDLNWNQEHGGFISWKWDFAYLNDYNGISNTEAKARNFIKRYNHQVSLNWDLTESAPRYGFFWAREYGIIFLTNRECSPHILYTPSVALRDVWDLAKYINTNKFQITIRNVKNQMVAGDAPLYGQDYATAIGCAGIPMFFEKLVTYSLQDRKIVRTFLDIYKKERDAMFESYIFPVGDKPSNASFTGFQFVNPVSKTGNLLLFREVYSTEAEKDIKLSFLKNKKIKLYDLRNNTQTTIQVNNDGFATFKIANPSVFAFYRYEIL